MKQDIQHIMLRTPPLPVPYFYPVYAQGSRLSNRGDGDDSYPLNEEAAPVNSSAVLPATA